MRVVTENTPPTARSPFFELPPAAPAPPPRRRRVTVDRARVERLDVDGLAAELAIMLGQLQNRTPAEVAAAERAPDGTIAVKSMIAVCLIGTVGKAFGKPRLVNLGRVRREELKSIGGIARLIRTALDQLNRGAA